MRWRRIAVNGLLVCSLYLLAASAAVFVSGRWAMIGPVTTHRGSARLSVGVHEGLLSVEFDKPANSSMTWPPRIDVSFAGITLLADWSRSVNGMIRVHPLVGMVVALVLLLRARRRIGERRIGYCPECNYDLRATPNHCPECGWAAATARPPESPLVGMVARVDGVAITSTTFSMTPVAPAPGTP